jgi:hypothetical protein
MLCRKVIDPNGVKCVLVMTTRGGGRNRVATLSLYANSYGTPLVERMETVKPGDAVFGLIVHAVKTGEVFPLLDWLEENRAAVAEAMPGMRKDAADAEWLASKAWMRPFRD